MKAVLLARVSTKEQTEGFSLNAQVDRIEGYIEKHKDLQLEDDAKFVFDESARKTDRTKFDDVLRYVEKHKQNGVVAICSDKVDRLIRNFAQSIHKFNKLLEAGEIELHFVSDNLVMAKDSSATEKFMFNIAVSLAQYYSDAISDNILRGHERLIKEGKWFGGRIPFGYLNVSSKSTGRREDIIANPETRDLVVEMFERYATGEYSLESIAEYLQKKGVKTWAGRDFTPQKVHKILCNTFYYGIANTQKYGEYKHCYEPLITKILFDKVADQRVGRDRSHANTIAKHGYVFQGLITCKRCGCLYTPEIKKGKYVYYSCTNSKKVCKRVYVTEKKLLQIVEEVLKSLTISSELAAKITDYLRKFHDEQSIFHSKQLEKLRQEYDALEKKIDAATEKLFDGGVQQDIYDKKTSEYRARQRDLNEEMGQITQQGEFKDSTIKTVFSLSNRAYELFDSSDVKRKREIVKILFQNLEAEDEKAYFALRKPFDTVGKLPVHLDWCGIGESNS